MNNLILPINDRNPQEYLEALNESIAELKMLVFSNKDLTLRESQCFALHTLSEFQKRLMENREQ